ncbi:MAG: hypothetical protein J4F35_23485 [Candidatus Latescibacteria bacterium]|nr:hypothetical protein [Candidatus Latescibacterota bacterium]
MRHLLIMVVCCCAPALAGEWVQEGADSFAAGLFAGTEIDSLGRVSLASFRGANLALDASASSGPHTLSGRRSVTDGNTDTEWLVAPGHHLLRVEIDAVRADVWTGLVGVVY